MHRQIAHEDLPNDVLADAQTQLVSVLDQMEQQLQGSLWLAGATFSLADLTWAPFVDRMKLLGLITLVDRDARPAVANWLNRCRARDSYQTAVIDYMRPPDV